MAITECLYCMKKVTMPDVANIRYGLWAVSHKDCQLAAKGGENIMLVVHLKADGDVSVETQSGLTLQQGVDYTVVHDEVAAPVEPATPETPEPGTLGEEVAKEETAEAQAQAEVPVAGAAELGEAEAKPVN